MRTDSPALPADGAVGVADAANEAAAAGRFEAVPVFLDPKGRGLAGYQFELSADNAELRVVGLENGDHPAFATPPYFDPAAVAAGGDRIVVAAYTVEPPDALPSARVRVTSVMVEVQAEPGRGSGNAGRLPAGTGGRGRRGGQPN